MSVPAGERRIVSVLVADVVGSTAIGERLGPERSKFLFDEVVGLMREEVERLDGTVAQLTGDGVLALFGAPVAHEDDAERAVRAALAVQEAISRYSDEIGPAYEIELGARVAVNTGPVVIPAGDAAPDVLYNALGDTVNVAARLQSLADIVIGPETARQVDASFELEPLGELELKGKTESLAAFRVTGERATPVETVATPLVGRDDELGLLERILAELTEGRGAIVTITGEPGIGKSRLKTEARSRFEDRVRFLEGHAVAYAHEIPYWPFRELLRDWLGLGVSDPEASVRLELRAGLAATLGDGGDEAYPFVATLLGLPLERAQTERIGELSSDSVQQQTFDAVRRLVAALARERPLCLVLEDLQWADEATLALVEELFPATDDEVALLLSLRTEGDQSAWDLTERARRRYRHRFEELQLTPLEQVEAVELASGAAGGALPDSVGALLAERSGGNPFFLEEALRDLIERGVLRRENGTLVLANGGAISVPSLVQEALQARLDRLEPESREVISIASVVGRSFGMPLLEQLVEQKELRPALTELQRLDLVVEERRRPTPEYRFRHGLVQEVAYGGLVEARRQELHRVVGAALEQLHREAPDEVYGLLAHHFSEADDPERAIGYLLRAGDAARAVYANEEAVEVYRRALAFMRRTGDEQRARETLLRIALTHHLAFDFERAGAAYEEAFELPPPEPVRIEPSERLASAEAIPDGHVPGDVHTESTWVLVRHLFRGLVSIGRDSEIVPDVAESFAVSADGKTYRFRIRADARWSDGTPLTADDFVFTWRTMRDEGVPTAHLLRDVRSADALDAATLEVSLHAPRNYFLYLVGQPPFFPWPRKVYEELGAVWAEQRPLVGNGPFVLVAHDDSHLVLSANPSWTGSRGNVGEIDIQLFRNISDAHTEWRRRRYDALPLFNPARSTGVSEPEADTIALSDPGLGTIYLGFRFDRPPLDDVTVRRALAHGIDKAAPALLQAGDPAGSGGFIPPTIPGHSHRVTPAHDPERAHNLLAAAGYPDGRGFPELILAQVLGLPAGPEIASQLEAIGITTRIAEAPLYEAGRLFAGEVDLFLWAWSADFPDPTGMITAVLETAPILHRDPRVDQLLAESLELRDQDERLAACREAERIWIDELVSVVPLTYFRRTSLLRPWVEGFWQNGLVTSTFADVLVRPELRSAARSD